MSAPDRPLCHFTPPSGWMNDPNGLVFHDGEYHLFYQHHPHSLVWGPMHWGHAVSRNLLDWEHLPIALAPDANGTIFSGSAVWDGGNSSGLVPGGGLAAVFSYDSQAQGLAYSRDRGRSWSMYAGNPIMPALSKDFRDPKVFRHGADWAMVIAAGDHLEFFRSPDLREWTRAGRFDAPLDAGVWECPDLFPLAGPDGGRWVLVLSVGDKAVNGGSGTMYWVGAFDGAGFVPESGPHWLDWGTDNYAGVSWNGAPDGRRLFIGWMNNWSYGREIPAQGWRGAMTLPRELSLSADRPPCLVQQPVAALAARRRDGRRFPPAPLRTTLPLGPLPPAWDLELRLRAGPGAAAILGWNAPGFRAELRWDPAAGTLVLDRGISSGQRFHPAFARPITMALRQPAESLSLRIVGDRTSLEVFAEEGRSALTARIFPPDGPLELALSAGGGPVSLLSGELHGLAGN